LLINNKFERKKETATFINICSYFNVVVVVVVVSNTHFVLKCVDIGN